MIYSFKNWLRSKSHSNKYAKLSYVILNRLKVNILSILSDTAYAKLKYRENTGKTLNITEPTTFNEKLWWLKLNNRDPLLTKCSDKYLVREYIKEKGLEEILIPLYGAYDDAKDIPLDRIPSPAFIKTNNGSGANILWNKENPFDKEKFIKDFNQSLKDNYYLQSREWNYKHINPKIVIEKVLEDNNNISLIDYRFLCFDGEAKLVFVDIETAASDGKHNPNARRNVYTKDFKYLDVKVKRENFDTNLVSKPFNFELMVEYAERLSHPFPFCRVDLYNVDGKIYFGEITFYPGGGTQLFEPEEWEIEVGKWIDLNSKQVVRG